MRKIIIMTIATIILSLSLVTIVGCHDRKDRELGKIKEQVNVLRLENSQLKKIIARNETCKSGTTFTTFGLGIMVVISGGLVVWVVNRRRNDGTRS